MYGTILAVERDGHQREEKKMYIGNIEMQSKVAPAARRSKGYFWELTAVQFENGKSRCLRIIANGYASTERSAWKKIGDHRTTAYLAAEAFSGLMMQHGDYLSKAALDSQRTTEAIAERTSGPVD
jgi:hypothetical protein